MTTSREDRIIAYARVELLFLYKYRRARWAWQRRRLIKQFYEYQASCSEAEVAPHWALDYE